MNMQKNIGDLSGYGSKKTSGKYVYFKHLWHLIEAVIFSVRTQGILFCFLFGFEFHFELM